MSKYKARILELRAEGRTLEEISKKLKCAPSTVSYHVYPEVRHQAQKVSRKRVKKYPYVKKMSAFCERKRDFNRVGVYPKGQYQRERAVSKFKTKDLLEKIGPNPTCYLTGQSIDLNDTQSYALDHIIPVYQGGDNSLSNLGLTTKEANAAKAAKTPTEFFELCKKVLEHNGYKVTKMVEITA